MKKKLQGWRIFLPAADDSTEGLKKQATASYEAAC